MRQIYRTFFLLFAILFIFRTANAQTLGSFNVFVDFQGSQRALALYVPADYDSTKSYRLIIGLHGLGDNANNYRDGLIKTNIDWKKYFPNTIFVFPEAVATTSDFFAPEGSGAEQIIDVSAQYVMDRYNIDQDNVILQGFSLGGRAALRYGLEHYTKFKGLILNTPAVQGVKEALNLKKDYHFKYENASKIPIYITHGSEDIAYLAVDDTVFRMLVMNNGKTRKNLIPNIGHSFPYFNQMDDVLDFIEQPAETGMDAALEYLIAPISHCNTAIPVSAIVRNTGSETLNKINITFKSGSHEVKKEFNVNLKSFEHAVLTLNGFAVDPGLQMVEGIIESANDKADPILSNNSAGTQVQTFEKSLSIPYANKFEGPKITTDGWALNSSGDFWAEWVLDSSISHKGSAAAFTSMNNLFIFDNIGRRDEIISPPFDLSNMTTAQMRFDVFYNYTHYTTNVLTVDTVFADTLEVLASKDCGATWQSVYKKGGTQLATFATPITDALSIQQLFITPADSNWRTEGIDLSAVAGSDNVMIKFSYISALGGVIGIDKFAIDKTLSIRESQKLNTIKLYPNPASQYFQLFSSENKIQQVQMYDLSGKICMNKTPNRNEVKMDVSHLPKGIYFVKVITASGTQTMKINLQ